MSVQLGAGRESRARAGVHVHVYRMRPRADWVCAPAESCGATVKQPETPDQAQPVTADGIPEEEECAGLFGPCLSLVTRHLEPPPDMGGPSVPLCEEHWAWTMDLEERLRAEPEFRDRFALAIDKVRSGGEQ